MARSQRLLTLLEILRAHRHAVSGQYLADKLNISLQTLYRDIRELRGTGAQIEGEPGVGYILKSGFTLPPLMFSIEQIKALVLGTRWVAQRTDPDLATAARQALAKISAVLPPDLASAIERTPLLVPPSPLPYSILESKIRHAMECEHKLALDYCDHHEQIVQTVIWPVAYGYFDESRMLAAWCEQRGKYKHYRIDRIRHLEILDQRYPRRNYDLLREWRDMEKIPHSVTDTITF